MARYEWVEQHAEEDCGAACLVTVARHHGRRPALSRVRELVGTGTKGTTLLGLRRGADALGFHVRAVRADPALLEQLGALPLPAICHWKGNHWVVLYGRRGARVVIADPAVGIRTLAWSEFREGWGNGVMLLLEPDLNRLLQQPEEKRGPFLRFLRLTWPYRTLLLQALSINIVIGLLALAMPLLMQLLTDDVLVRRDSQLLTSLGLAMLFLFVFRSAISLIQGHMVGHFAQRLQLGMVLEYGHQLLRMPMTYFDSHRSGEVVSRIGDISRINALISQLVLGLPSQLFIASISLVVMVMYSFPLAIVSLLAFGLLVASGLAFLPAQYEKNRRLIVESAENQGFLVEIFRGAQVLKTTEALPQVWDEYQRNFGSVAHLRWNTLQLALFSGTTTGLLSRLTTLGLLWYGSSFVISGQLSIGQLLAFSGMSGNVLSFLESLVDFADDFLSAKVVIRRLSEVLEGSLEDPKAMQKPWVALSPSSEIRCRNLSFHHTGRLDLLHQFNLTFPAGCCTALIGESGCGKSTLVKLLAGLYAPQSGTIHYGPYGLQDISLECLRRQVILVPQEAQFFNRTIFDNFRFAYPDLSFDQVVRACQTTLADEFIRDLPDGYQTILGEFGANLSGGQRQRLAIARALVSHPPVLILDESTAALDPVLESRLMDKLLEERRGLTTLMISHRPSVIRRCDWVVYLERGAVACQGSPHDLRETPSLAAYLLPA